jgi:hypothetical protein
MTSPMITFSYATPVGNRKHPMNTDVNTSVKRASVVDIGKDTNPSVVNFTIEGSSNEAATLH